MINDRQFVLSKNEYKCENWSSALLSTGFVLSWHNDLKVVFNKDKSIALLGYAWQVDGGKKAPEELVKNISASISKGEIKEMESTWCGRYVLIVREELYLDTCGTLSVYYSKNITSSSLNLLCLIENINYRKPKIYHGVFPDFIPGANTEYKDVKRVLPSSVYNYVNNTIETRELLLKDYSLYTKKQLTELFIEYFTTSLKNMKYEFDGKTIWLALTGGRDSRTTLAMLEKSKIEYKTFTLEHGDISMGDIEIPCMLMKKIGKEWRYLRRDKKMFSRQVLKDYEKHCAGMAVDEDRLFFAYNQYKDIVNGEQQIIVLRSSVYECVISYFEDYIKEGKKFDADELAVVFPLLCMNGEYKQTLKEWFEYIRDDSLNKNISPADRFLWELREGCWLSNIEQSYDMLENIISIQPANCRRFLELLSSYDLTDRKIKKHQEEIISVACPIISNVPYEGKSSSSRGTGIMMKASMLIKKGMWMLQTYGFKDTIFYFSHKR